MTVSTNEQISSLVDSELADIDLENNLNAFTSTPAMRNTWARYHLIRDVMQNEYVPAGSDFAERVSLAIKDEPALVVAPSAAAPSAASTKGNAIGAQVTSIHSSSKPAANSTWKRNTMGFAVAASVAVVSLVGLNMLRTTDDPGSAAQLAEAPASIPIPLDLVSNTGTYWISDDESEMTAINEQRLNMYLSQHIENSPTANVQGMLPYSRLAGYDEVRRQQK